MFSDITTILQIKTNYGKFNFLFYSNRVRSRKVEKQTQIKVIIFHILNYDNGSQVKNSEDIFQRNPVY